MPIVTSWNIISAPPRTLVLTVDIIYLTLADMTITTGYPLEYDVTKKFSKPSLLLLANFSDKDYQFS